MQAAGLIVSGRRTSRCAVIQTARVASPHLPCASRFIEAVQRLNRTTSASRQACGLAGCTGPSATRRSCPPPHVHNDLRPTPGLGCRVTTIRLGGHLDGSRATATARGGMRVTPDLDTLPCTRYPQLFARRNFPMDKSCMFFGFPGSGWIDLLDALCERLQFWTHRRNAVQLIAEQVKEKGSSGFSVGKIVG